MLAIRLQRVGRTGYATYRVVVQEAQKHPTSGRVVAFVGSYNPHTKETKIQVGDAQKYLDNGAQPSPRVAKILAANGVKMPKWVVSADSKTKSIKNSDKLRKNQPAKPAEEVVAEEPAEEVAEVAVEETAAEEVAAEAEVVAEPVAEEAAEITEAATEETA
ncbi:MAG: 30S ribosomal protein S16 [Candidatus Saccharibacteria bacterium]